MLPESACGNCHRVLGVEEKRYGYGTDVVCGKCLRELSDLGNICPACHKALKSEDEEIGLVLLPADDAPPSMAEPRVLLIVCPHCRVMFFDKFQYEVLRAFKVGAFKFASK